MMASCLAPFTRITVGKYVYLSFARVLEFNISKLSDSSYGVEMMVLVQGFSFLLKGETASSRDELDPLLHESP